MLNSSISEKIAAIHSSLNRGIFVLTGGGSEFLSRLLSVPGASHTVLEASIPYSPEAMTEFLHQKPEQFCSELTARRIAAMAWHRAMKYAHSDSLSSFPINKFFGFGLTAVLSTSREHRGEHRVFAAFHSLERTVSYSLKFEKGKWSRAEEEKQTADWALELLASYCETDSNAHEIPATREQIAPESWQKVMTGELPFIELNRDGSVSTTLSPKLKAFSLVHSLRFTKGIAKCILWPAENYEEKRLLNFQSSTRTNRPWITFQFRNASREFFQSRNSLATKSF